MQEITIAVDEILGLDRKHPPARRWWERFEPVVYLIRRVTNWPKLSPYELWEIKCIIHDEFMKELANQYEEAVNPLGEVAVEYTPPGGWN